MLEKSRRYQQFSCVGSSLSHIVCNLMKAAEPPSAFVMITIGRTFADLTEAEKLSILFIASHWPCNSCSSMMSMWIDLWC